MGKGGGRGEGRGSRERGWKTRGKERLNFPLVRCTYTVWCSATALPDTKACRAALHCSLLHTHRKEALANLLIFCAVQVLEQALELAHPLPLVHLRLLQRGREEVKARHTGIRTPHAQKFPKLHPPPHTHITPPTHTHTTPHLCSNGVDVMCHCC